MVGNSAGRLIIDGDFYMEGGVLELEIGGTQPAMFEEEPDDPEVSIAGVIQIAGLHDVLEVTGDAEFFGTVILKFIDGFAPQQGHTFGLMDVGGSIDFAPSLVVQGLRPGFEYSLAPNASGIIVLTALNDGVLVPEPTPLSLLTLGCSFVLCGRAAYCRTK